MELPLTKVTAEVRLLTGDDETSISQNATKRRASALETNLTDQLTRCIVALNDDTDKNTIKQFVELMPARDSRHLRNAVKAVTPNVDMSQNFYCSACGHEQNMEVPLRRTFFGLTDDYIKNVYEQVFLLNVSREVGLSASI